MSDHLRGWLAATSAEERERVAREARTSVAHLWQLAGGHRKASHPSLNGFKTHLAAKSLLLVCGLT